MEFELGKEDPSICPLPKSRAFCLPDREISKELVAWTDAGFAGTDTKSQNGLVITWGGSIVVWRGSRQTVAALSTAEAELNSAAGGWQIMEGLRLLIS